MWEAWEQGLAACMYYNIKRGGYIRNEKPIAISLLFGAGGIFLLSVCAKGSYLPSSFAPCAILFCETSGALLGYTVPVFLALQCSG